MRKILMGLAGVALVAGLCGCSAATSQDASSTGEASSKTIEEQLSFTKRDMDPSYDEESATRIELVGTTASVTGDGASADGSTITIDADGTYIVSGTLDDGQIIVDLPGDEDKAQIVLDGAVIHNDDGPALQIDQADKVFLTLASGSANELSDGANYALDGEDDKRDATIYSKDDLTINGDGTLEVTGNYSHAIASSDDAVITGGTISLVAAEDAVNANDAIKIGGGSITVNAGDDAFHSEYLFYIADGTVNVESCAEGYEAEKIYVNGGDTNIVASDDGINASAAESSSDTQAGQVAQAPQDAGMPEEPADIPAGAPSSPGAGEFPRMQDGQFDAQGDPGARGQDMPAMRGEREALQGDEPQFQGQQPQGQGGAAAGQAMPGASEECLIQINGGTLTVNAGGDGLDSNGSIEINGGTVLVSGASMSDDTGLDYEYEATVNGGDVILIGSAGMAEDFTGGTQEHVTQRTNGSAGQTIEVLDGSGKVLVSYVAPKAFQMVNASAPGAASIQVS